MTQHERRQLARAVAVALLAGAPELDAACARLAEMFGREWGWGWPLAKRFLAAYANGVRPRRVEVETFLLGDRRFRWACTRFAGELKVARPAVGPALMQPVPEAAGWNLPRIETVAELAEWLRLNPMELAWFADLKGLNRVRGASADLSHYHYSFVAKASGGVRLIEAPKGRMKALQRQILAEILDRVPVHGAVHGFVRGRSIKSFAAPHAGQDLVLRMDLQDFFPSIPRARVQSVFLTLGYPEPIADLLGGICASRIPRGVFRGFAAGGVAELRRLYERTHLPQGAPTSPMLANLCAYRLDCRLSGLAKAAGGVYTRYADDLAFSGSGGFARGAASFARLAREIVEAEGFAVNPAKTRAMRRGVRQHLAGLVVNDGVNLKREEIDRLKAILINCARNGPEAENREGLPDFSAHLAGRISFVAMIRPDRGAKLRELFGKIDWRAVEDAR